MFQNGYLRLILKPRGNHIYYILQLAIRDTRIKIVFEEKPFPASPVCLGDQVSKEEGRGMAKERHLSWACFRLGNHGEGAI